VQLQEDAEEQALAGHYDEGIALLESGLLDSALAAFETILSIRPDGYRDTQAKAEEALRLLAKRTVAEARALGEAGQCAEALTRLRAIADIAPASPVAHELIAAFAVDCYLEHGRRLVGADAPRPPRVREAIEQFRLALEIDPANPDATVELQIAERYLEGYEAYRDGNWHDAASALTDVYQRRADYLGDITANLLYDALLNSGERYAEQGDRADGCEQFWEAVDLPVANKAWATGALARWCGDSLPATPPASTPAPLPAATPTPGPKPTAVPVTPVVGTIEVGCCLPLEILRPYVFYYDRAWTDGTDEWWGHIGIFFSGGCSPYRFALNEGPFQADNYLEVRGEACQPLTWTVHMQSCDGQEATAETELPGWCPDAEGP
jgi:hypothetical protein